MNHSPNAVRRGLLLATAVAPMAPLLPHACGADLTYDAPANAAQFTVGNDSASPSVSFAGGVTDYDTNPANPGPAQFDSTGSAYIPGYTLYSRTVTAAVGTSKYADGQFIPGAGNDPTFGDNVAIDPVKAGTAPDHTFTVTSQAQNQLSIGVLKPNAGLVNTPVTYAVSPQDTVVSQQVTFHLGGTSAYVFDLSDTSNVFSFLPVTNAQATIADNFARTSTNTTQFSATAVQGLGSIPLQPLTPGGDHVVLLPGGTLTLLTTAENKWVGSLQFTQTDANYDPTFLQGNNAQITVNYAPLAVPEPAAVVLFLPAIAGLLGRRRGVRRH